MPDKREEILDKHSEYICDFGLALGVEAARNAMDEYMKECCLELLEYVAKKVSNFWIDDNGVAKFRLSGDEELTREQLFENFL